MWKVQIYSLIQFSETVQESSTPVMITACRWLSGVLPKSFRDPWRIGCPQPGCLDSWWALHTHSFSQQAWTRLPAKRHEWQLSLSSFHNLMKDWSLEANGHCSFCIRKYSSRTKLGCQTSLYTILHHNPKLPERVYLETKTFSFWT